MNKSPTTPQERGRKRHPRDPMFDPSLYKHIGSHICRPVGFTPDMTSAEGVMKFINRSMVLPIGKNDPDDTLFLLTEIYALHDHVTLHFFSYTRYEDGFFSDFNFAVLNPSPMIFQEIDAAIDKEWNRLVQEKARRDSILEKIRP